MAKNNKKTAPEAEKEQPASEQTKQTQQSEQGQVPASTTANYGGEMEEQPQAAGKDSPKAKVKADGKTEKIAKSIFSEHPEEDTVYITSDGFGYFNEHDARNHARTLPNDEIVTITRY